MVGLFVFIQTGEAKTKVRQRSGNEKANSRESLIDRFNFCRRPECNLKRRTRKAKCSINPIGRRKADPIRVVRLEFDAFWLVLVRRVDVQIIRTISCSRFSNSNVKPKKVQLVVRETGQPRRAQYYRDLVEPDIIADWRSRTKWKSLVRVCCAMVCFLAQS